MTEGTLSSVQLEETEESIIGMVKHSLISSGSLLHCYIFSRLQYAMMVVVMSKSDVKTHILLYYLVYKLTLICILPYKSNSFRD